MKALATKVGTRKIRPDGERSRTAILDAAEYLFSFGGLVGVSIRQITKLANTDLASVNYHFKSKENLFQGVLARRVDTMSRERLRRLDAFHESGDTYSDVHNLLQMFVAPLFGVDEKECADLANYRRLVALVANSKAWQDAVFKKFYDPTAKAYIDRLSSLLPGVPRASIYWTFTFFLGALTASMAETGRVDRLSDGACESSNLVAMQEELLKFVTGGLVMQYQRNI